MVAVWEAHPKNCSAMATISVAKGQTASLNRAGSDEDFQHVKMGLLFELEMLEPSMIAFKTLLLCWLSGKVDDQFCPQGQKLKSPMKPPA